MVPSSLGAVLVFVLFVAPGLLFDLLSARRKAGIPESTFREASRVVLASAALTLSAALLLACLASPWRARLPDPVRLVQEPTYQRAHSVGVGVALLATSIAACLLAVAIQAWRGRGSGPPLRRESAWQYTFLSECPDDKFPYVRARMNNGTTYLGFVGKFTPNIETAGRELVLEPPLWVKRPDKPPAPLASEWQRVILSGDDIVSVMVSYRPRPERLAPRIDAIEPP